MNKIIFVTILILILVTIGFSGCLEDEQVFTSESIKIMIYNKSQDFVRQRLKVPSTAKFAPIDEAYIKEKTPGVWVVVSYVDAQNIFGVYLRNYYACEILKNGDSFYLSALNIDEDLNDVYYVWEYETSINSYQDMRNYTIYIDQDVWKIEWEVGGVEDYSYGGDVDLSVRVYDENQSLVGLIVALDPYDSGVEFINEGHGIFHIEIIDINLDSWSLKIYEGRNILS